MSNALEKIIADKKSNIEKYKKSFTIENLKKKISSYNNYLNFKDKLNQNKVSVVAEIKKASPSAGSIIKNYDPWPSLVSFTPNFCTFNCTRLVRAKKTKSFLKLGKRS